MGNRVVLTLVLASSNRGKLEELRALLGGLPVEVRCARDVLGVEPDVEEDGATFEANAEKKAREVCRATGTVAIADDSGLEVDALGGRPGVHSARFAGEHGRDEDNNQKLLAQLSAVSTVERTARFRCVLALASPWHPRVWLARGSCEGVIGSAPRGSRGFGYDPLFVPNDAPGRTMAELEPAEKNRISHRSRAAAELRPAVHELLRSILARANRIAE